MPFSLVKAIKSTHMNSVNRKLHCIGAPFYIFGIVMIVGHFLGTSDFNLLTGIILWSIAVGLFLTGHKIERNLRAMTLIILFRYFSVLGMAPNLMLGLVNRQSLPQGKQFHHMK